MRSGSRFILGVECHPSAVPASIGTRISALPATGLRVPHHAQSLATLGARWRYCVWRFLRAYPSIQARTALARELSTARLLHKECISQVAQCYHFDFVVEGVESFPFSPGQFISAVAEDPNGKQQTRAYSIASAPYSNHFELCVNRVENGF